jgi:hypothetical protein
MRTCPKCGLKPALEPSSLSVCVDCEKAYEHELEKLRTDLEAAKERYDKARVISDDLGHAHRDGAHGLGRASYEHTKATIRYAQAIVERTKRRVPDFPK